MENIIRTIIQKIRKMKILFSNEFINIRKIIYWNKKYKTAKKENNIIYINNY